MGADGPRFDCSTVSRVRWVSLLLFALCVALGFAAPAVETRAAAPRLEFRKGYAQPIDELALAGDGARLILWSGEAARAWDLVSGRPLPDPPDTPREVRTESFSPQAEWLARARADGTIELRDIKTFAEPQTLTGHTAPVRALAFHPNGESLASASADGTVVLWHVREARKAHVLRHADEVTDVVFAPDGSSLASASRDRTVRLWDPATGAERASLAGHADAVTAVCFTPDGRWLVSAGHDGSARVWDPRSATQLAALGTMRKRDGWAVVTPDGRYDGSADGTRRLAVWRIGEQSVGVGELLESFFVPGLLGDVLAGRLAKAERDVAAIDLLRPTVRLRELSRRSSDDGPAAVRIALDVEQPSGSRRDRPGTARELRLYVDGALVEEWPGDVLGGGRSRRLETTVPLGPGEHRLAAHARNTDGLRSAPARLIVPGNGRPAAPTAHVLAIGITRYSTATFNLRYAARDASAVAAGLREVLGAVGRFAKVEALTLLDGEATRRSILEALDHLGSRTGPEDAVFIYFAGHGLSRGERYYLLGHDLGNVGSRTRLSGGVGLLFRAGVSDRDLAAALGRTPARWIVLAIDAAQPVAEESIEARRRGPMGSTGLALVAHEQDVYVLATSQAYRAAVEVAEGGSGILAHVLLDDVLAHPDADRPPRNGMIELEEWLTWAALRVPQLRATKLGEARAAGRDLVFVEGEQQIRDAAARSLQRPRLFLPRSPDRTTPLVVARPR